MFNKNIIKKSIHLNMIDPKPIQQIYSHKKKICSTNLLTYDKLSNNYFHFIHYAKIF